MDDRVLTLSEAARVIGRTRKTLWNWAYLQRQGCGGHRFPFRKFSGNLVVWESELREWMEEHMPRVRNGDAQKTGSPQEAGGKPEAVCL